MWQAAGAPAVASLCCKERGQKHLGYPREEIRAGLATGQVRNHQQVRLILVRLLSFFSQLHLSSFLSPEQDFLITSAIIFRTGQVDIQE